MLPAGLQFSACLKIWRSLFKVKSLLFGQRFFLFGCGSVTRRYDVRVCPYRPRLEIILPFEIPTDAVFAH
jgi:hypothetical protein